MIQFHFFAVYHIQPMKGTESFQEGTQEMLLVEVKSNSLETLSEEPYGDELSVP